MKILKLIILVCSFSSLSVSACNIEKVTTILKQQSLHANFNQSKKIAALSRPLLSKGKIWMSENGELIWQINVPIKSTMLIKDNGFKLFNKQDELQPDHLNTMVKDISSLFLTLLGGDLDKIQQMFEQSLTCNESTWQLELHPKQEKLSNLISSITLSGDTRLTGISFQENRGDQTTIELIHAEASDFSELEKYLGNHLEKHIEK